MTICNQHLITQILLEQDIALIISNYCIFHDIMKQLVNNDVGT